MCKTAGGPRDASLVDTAVYTRNRAFRLVLSSKWGKKARLLPTSRFFGRSLVAAAGMAASGLSEGAIQAREALAAASSTIFLESLITRVKSDALLVDGAADSAAAERTEQASSAAPRNVVSGGQRDSSPCPGTVAFICAAAAARGGGEAQCRSWSAFPEHGVLALTMCRNRWCDRIGRAHRSNNVSFWVDFRILGYYQRCFDPDCAGWRGDTLPLPPALASEAEALELLTESRRGAQEQPPPASGSLCASDDFWWTSLPDELWDRDDMVKARSSLHRT